MRAHGAWPIVSGVTFMSGTRHSDTHVEYILDTETWLGPYEDTPFEVVRDIADTIVASGLKAEALPDLRPAQWSKLVFNAAVNPTAALTGLPHDFHFAQEAEPGDLGHLVHGLVDEGKAVAAAAGIELHDDPWEMNVLATQTRLGALPVDARGRRRAPADRDRAHHRLARARGRAARRARPAALVALRSRQRKGSIVAGNAGTNRRAEMTKVGKAALALVAVAVVAVAVVSGGSAAPSRPRPSRSAGPTTASGTWRRTTGRRSRPRRQHIAALNKRSRARRSSSSSRATRRATSRRSRRRVRRSSSRQGADIIMTTCDVDYAAPVVQDVDQCREAHGRSVHRHRPDGSEALRRRRVASRSRTGTSRRTRARRWPSTRGSAAGRRASLATDTVIVYFRNVVQAFKARWHAARRHDRDRGDVPVGWREPGLVAEHRHATERDRRRRHRHVDGAAVRRAGPDPERPADAREQHAVPQLVGRRRELLVHAGSEGLELLLRDLRIGVRQRSRWPPSTRSQRRTRRRSRRPEAPAHSSPGRRRSTASSSRSSGRAATRTALRSPRRWRSSRTSRRCRGS